MDNLGASHFYPHSSTSGHPFPSLEPLEERRKEILAEHVKRSIKKDRCKRERMNSASFD